MPRARLPQLFLDWFAAPRGGLALGAYAGGLNLRDAVFARLFGHGAYFAHVLGRDRVYKVSHRRCLPDCGCRRRGGLPMWKDRMVSLCVAARWPAKVARGAGLAFSICGLANVVHAGGIETLHHIGDGYQSVRVITHYEIHADHRTFDLFAAEPAVPATSRAAERELAARTVHQICSGGRVGGGWTVRIFLPGDTSPAASCRPGGAQKSGH